MQKKYIVFDCDGTLITSEYAILKDIQSMVKKLKGQELTIDEVKAIYSPDLGEIAANIGFDFSKEEDRNKLTNAWREVVSTSKTSSEYALHSGIKDLLDKLSASSEYELYVWTARDRASTLSILKSLGVTHYFLDFRCMDDTIAKPHPQGLYDMLGKNKPAIVIGDSFTDIMGAQNYGCGSIAATWSTSVDKNSLKKAGAKNWANKPEDCIQLIESYFENIGEENV